MTYPSITNALISVAAVSVLVSACDLPVSEVSSTSSEAPYVPAPNGNGSTPGNTLPPDAPPIDKPAGTKPWDLPYDAGANPYYRQTDTFDVVNKAKQVDVLFVMDNSGSMAEEQAGVVDSFSKFLEGFTAERIDYHVGVVATDTISSSSKDYWVSAPYAHFLNDGPGSLLAYTGNPRFIKTEDGRSEALRQFRLNASLGIQGSGAETGLLAVTTALSAQKQTGWNKDFVRPGAMLSVVIVSDEDESVGDRDVNYVKANPANETVRVNDFVDTLKTLKPNRPDLLRLDLVVSPQNEVCATAAQVGDTYTKAYKQLYSGADHPAGKILNICKDFSGDLGDLGSQIAVQVERRFKLHTKVEGELKISVNGQVLPESDTNGYRYNETTGEVTLNGLPLESLDRFRVEVQYVAKK